MYIQAETDGVKTTKLYLNEINGQKFDNITTDSDKKKVVTDTAKPVLVVNEDVNGFLLGTQFSFSYEKIDVLNKADVLTESKTYYQYNPVDSSVSYKALTSGTYFMDTVYEKDGKTTSVYRGLDLDNDGNPDYKEYVSIKITLGDSVGKQAYELAWYAEDDAVQTINVKHKKDEEAKATSFIVVDRNEEGAYYYNQDSTTKEWKQNVNTKLEDDYQDLLDDKAKGVSAGSNSYMNFPSLDWFIKDNNGYSGLKFTICYKTPSSDAAKTSSNLSSNSLKLAASEEGVYEFKVFANNKAGNTMKYKDENGKLVSVSASNIWDIEEIPSFSYEIQNKGVSVKEDTLKDTDKVNTQLLSETYTFNDATIVGATTQKSAYALYKVNVADYNNSLTGDQKPITQAVLSSIKYSSILSDEVKAQIPTINDGNYFNLYINEYANLIAKSLGVKDAAQLTKIKNCFRKIEAFNDKIDKEKDPEAWDESDNKYNWQPDSKSFSAVEAGTYLVMADYWDEDMARIDHVPAFKLVVVDAETDVIKGETQWLRNNLVSVILFSVAALMLIAIIVLLLVKPSDETLADVDAKAAAKKKAADKKKADKKNN